MFDNGMRMQKAREVHEWANKEIKALKEEAINAISSAKNAKECFVKQQEYTEKFELLGRKIDEMFAKI